MIRENFKPVSYSEAIITELMVPSYTNFGGKIHGGVLLSLMDKVAYVCAAKHADAYCVTASIDAVDFLAPVEVGELVSLRASVTYVGKTSLEIGIKVIAENVKTHSVKHTNTSYFTMVAIDDSGKPATVPGLILENTQQVRAFLEGKHRKRMKKQYKEEIQQLKEALDNHYDEEFLSEERCLIALKPELNF